MGKRILLLADTASSHTEKWATEIAAKGYQVGLFSLNRTNYNWYRHNKNITLLNEPGDFHNSRFFGQKLKYLLSLPKLLRKIKKFQPDVLHAHYASSYGLLGALSGFRPFIISTWGSDVFEFPRKSLLQRHILKYNLSKADRILSTSYALKGELWHYTSKDVQVIPFGVNTKLFYPEEGIERRQITIGTIKSMEDLYGIPTILEAIPILKRKLPGAGLQFLFVGGGSQLTEYQKLADTLGLKEQVTFTGKIPFKEVPHYHNLLDIFLNVSTVDESFGVSVIEAMACERPVIVTDAPGLREIVNNDPNLGLIVQKKNATQLAEAILKLVHSPELRQKMGQAGRRHVLDNYDLKTSLEQMTVVYDSFLKPDKATVTASQNELHQPTKEPVA